MVKGEIPNTTNLATNASLNAKINELKGEIPNIINLATTSALLLFLKIKNLVLVIESQKLTITKN